MLGMLGFSRVLLFIAAVAAYRYDNEDVPQFVTPRSLSPLERKSAPRSISTSGRFERSTTYREHTVPPSVPPKTCALRAFRALASGANARKSGGKVVPVAGIEPATFGLQNRCSTS